MILRRLTKSEICCSRDIGKQARILRRGRVSKKTAGEAVNSAKDIIERRLTDKDIKEYIESGNRKNFKN